MSATTQGTVNMQKSASHSTEYAWSRLTHPLSVIGIVLLTPVLLGLGYDAYQSHQLNAELESLRAHGFPTSAEELNAYYALPAGVVDSTAEWMPAFKAAHLAVLSVRGSGLDIVGTGLWFAPRKGEVWSAFDEARAFVHAHATERELLLNAAARGGQTRFPVDFSKGHRADRLYLEERASAAKLLTLDAFVASHEGDSSRVLRDLDVILAMILATGNEPELFSEVLRARLFADFAKNAATLLSDSDWKDQDLQSLQKQVRAFSTRDELKRAVIGNRAILQTEIDSRPLLSPLKLFLRRESLFFQGETITALSAATPWSKCGEQMTQQFQDFGLMEINRIKPVSKIMRDSCSPISQFICSQWTEALRRCLHAAIAVLRFKIAHQKFPENLNEIPAEWSGPPELLTDPFDNAPLRMKNEADRIVIYSVDTNLADDGGPLLSGCFPSEDLGVILWKKSAAR